MGKRIHQKKRPGSKNLVLWSRFVRFATTYELTAKNVRHSLTKASKNFRPSILRTRQKSLALQSRLRLLLLILLVLLVPLILLLKDVPSPTRLTSGDFPVSTQIFDRNGELLYEIYADQNRTPIALSEIPEYVKRATIAIEDKHFYRHFGIDLEGVLRASFRTLSGQRLEGGSTITQQLVKMTLLTPKRTLTRKIREAVLAIATEVLYSKDQILEMYLNHAAYGGTAYGIEQASRLYFQKPAKDLSLSQAALLAGLPQAPTRYSPFGSYPDLALQRRDEVLRRMREDGYISREQEQEAQEEQLVFAPPSTQIRAPHFVLWVKDFLVNQFGERIVEQGGLRVTTTLDLRIQDVAQTSVSAEVARLARMRVGNGAALVTNPSTGEILAMVGSRDYFDVEHDGNVNVTLRPRQPGSSIKPIMYATGFSTGKLTPSTLWLDIPSCFSVPGQPNYCPRNYDGSFHGPVQVRFALGNSYNLPAVKSLAHVGVEEMIATASAMGITTLTDPSRYGLSLTLGGGEVTMVDMATAFGTLANNGVKVPLNPFLKIEDYRGNVLYQRSSDDRLAQLLNIQNTQNVGKSAGQNSDNPTLRQPDSSEFSEFSEISPVIPPEAAYLTSHILLDNNARSAAFGQSSQLVIPNQVVSVKTGTTNDLRDNWTLGYTPERLVAVWVGNNDNTPMNQALVSGITGAAPIWHTIMNTILAGHQPIWPEKPAGVIGQNVCSLTGKLPTPENPCDTRYEYFWEKFLPENNGPIQREIWIRKDTGAPVDPRVPLDQQGELELQTHTVISDPLIPEFCLDCSYPVVQELNPDGTTKEEHITYPGSTIDTTKIPLSPHPTP